MTLIDEGGESETEFEKVYREYFRDVELFLLALSALYLTIMVWGALVLGWQSVERFEIVREG